jgi:transcriptional antiterminator RfaH
MPIRQEETVLFPADLLESGDPLSMTANGQWSVLYTKPRHEKSVARQLLAKSVPFYLPLQRKTAYFRGRSITSLLPVFPSYIFMCSCDDDRDAAWKTNRVISILDVFNGERLRRDLQQVRRLIESDVPITVESRIQPGDRVRVRLGPFAGMEGTVLVRRGETRLLVAVDFLQRGASVAIDDYMLESLGPSHTRRELVKA